MTDKPKQDEEKEPGLKRPDQAIKDLAPDEHEGEAIKGGITLNSGGIAKT